MLIKQYPQACKLGDIGFLLLYFFVFEFTFQNLIYISRTFNIQPCILIRKFGKSLGIMENAKSLRQLEEFYRSYITKRYTLYNTHYTLHNTQNQGTLARCPNCIKTF